MGRRQGGQAVVSVPRYKINILWGWFGFTQDDENGKFCEYRDYVRLFNQKTITDNPRPRWQIFIGYGDDGQVRYYFENTDPDFGGQRQPGVNYGRSLLFKGRNFYFKLKAHDAIEYCIGLNAINAAKEGKPIV